MKKFLIIKHKYINKNINIYFGLFIKMLINNDNHRPTPFIQENKSLAKLIELLKKRTKLHQKMNSAFKVGDHMTA